jgi:hypothetical protein
MCIEVEKEEEEGITLRTLFHSGTLQVEKEALSACEQHIHREHATDSHTHTHTHTHTRAHSEKHTHTPTHEQLCTRHKL